MARAAKSCCAWQAQLLLCMPAAPDWLSGRRADLSRPFLLHHRPLLSVLPCTGVAVISTSLPSKFQAPEYRFVRAVVFTLLGAWGVVPVTHLLITHGHVWAIRIAFQLDMLMGLIYLVSAVSCCA